MPFGMELGLGTGHFVLDGDPVVPSPKRERAPRIFAHVYCDQTAGWIKMALGVEIGLGPGEFVSDGDPALTPKKEAEPPSPNFRPISIVTKRLHASKCHLLWS